FAALFGFLLQNPPGFFPRLRCIQQCDARAYCRACHKPNQTIVLLRHNFILPRGILKEMEHTVTVFRSADLSAEDDVRAVIDMLAAEGIAGTVLDDNSPGVPEGAWEVRVAPDKSAQAEALVETFRAV